ncbi:DUF1810 domain-containing protein [Pedobacter sp. AW1-32]|uniref:DUF1810 domain-containing protein n=1 Tax=Pedobacter sp. AW1-32 TaxID=3383026 RepID=UPI003FEDEA63
MSNKKDLDRFLSAQEKDYRTAVTELEKGKKKSHWMWYIFPQIKGLGRSEVSLFYGINNLSEAEEYLHDPILGSRLKYLCGVLLKLEELSATEIFGTPDDLKLKSSMTLFASTTAADPIFEEVLGKYFNGEKDKLTIELLGRLY